LRPTIVREIDRETSHNNTKSFAGFDNRSRHCPTKPAIKNHRGENSQEVLRYPNRTVIPSAAPFSLLEWQIVDRRYFGWFLQKTAAHIHGENAPVATLLSLMLELNLRVALRICINPIA
jgi:hypothetical protein